MQKVQKVALCADTGREAVSAQDGFTHQLAIDSWWPKLRPKDHGTSRPDISGLGDHSMHTSQMEVLESAANVRRLCAQP